MSQLRGKADLPQQSMRSPRDIQHIYQQLIVLQHECEGKSRPKLATRICTASVQKDGRLLSVFLGMMCRLSLLLTVLLALGTSALPSLVRSCGQIAAPSTILSVSKENRDEPSKLWSPYISANQLVDSLGNKLGVATILRFTPPANGTNCQFVVNFPSSRFADVQQGKADWQKPPELAISKLSNLAPDSLPSYNELEIVPGPWGSIKIQQGQIIVNTESCDTATDYLLEIPNWIAGNMGASWRNDVLVEANNPNYSLGAFLQYNC
ncbi:hypothetical protein B0H63DRAFT_483832 [Podospora didyma]|uniref:Ubiquitin 3 binding protein But2 C-terminal domain-containing protein n=1 Tax=Podospora didyma TaxID=330526 RepID=A0AAE0K9K9_9PEZI|nr:hypothetical protein B0H63DRAFT_483832 [Podospora didyma]